MTPGATEANSKSDSTEIQTMQLTIEALKKQNRELEMKVEQSTIQ